MNWMKKTAVVLSAAMLLSGCAAGQPGTTGPQNLQTKPSVTQAQPQLPQISVLSAEKMQEIESAWYAAMNTELESWYTEAGETVTDGVRYYGTYGGYDILLYPTNDAAVTSLVIGNVTITEPSTFQLYAYKDGQFRELKDVYLQGLISDEALEGIKGTHLTLQRKIYPLFTNPGDDAELYDLMKEAFLKQFVSKGEGSKKDLSIIYYGNYDGAHVAFINGIFAYTQAMTSEKVGQYTFHYRTGQKLLLYYEGELMYLTQAYERGILSDESVAELHRVYEKPSNVEKE